MVYNKASLAEQYGVSYQTLRKWCLPLKEKLPRPWNAISMFTPKEIQIIYDFLGPPPNSSLDALSKTKQKKV